MLSIACFAGGGDCYVINVHVHVYNMNNLTRTSVGYHYENKPYILGQAHYTPYDISCSTRDMRISVT